MQTPPPPPPPISSVNTSCSVSVIPQLDGNNSSRMTDSYSIPSLDNSFEESILSSSVYSGENNPLESSWFSQMSECDPTQPQLVYPVPVITGHRPYRELPARQPAVRRVIRRENKCIQALSLPTIVSYNMRSIWSKINSFSEDMHERSAEIGFLCEVWEKSESKKHQKKIEEMLEMCNISYISTPRPGAKRGGGAAIAFSTAKFTITKLNIQIPNPLEIVWALLRPIEPTADIRKVILCSFYSPPNSKKNKLLIDHISMTYNSLKIQHPKAASILSGDKNNLDEKHILALNPNFRQMVSKNTRKNKILTIVISDLHSYYHTPLVIPPVPVDVTGHGVPSDHSGVLAVPISNGDSQRKTESRKVKVRPMPDSLVTKFGKILVDEDWSFLSSNMTSTELVNAFEKHTSSMVESIFPEKNITISSWDKPYMTEELRTIRRQRQRAYRKGAKNEKYLQLKQKYNDKLKIEAEKYRKKIMAEVKDGKRNNAYSALRKLESGDNFDKRGTFTLPGHAEDNLTPAESAERLATYFSKISQEFEPICVENFPPWIKEKLMAGRNDQCKPILEDWQVYEKLRASKKPSSVIPGDLPVKLIKEFTPELANPVTRIYNRITETAEYPRQWVVEYQLAIPKVQPPLSEDDTRNIASTAYLSKQYESFIGDWIFPYIEPFLDPGQCGGLKGSSITHYLVRLLHFVHSFLDLKQPHAVLLALVDLEKAFNRVSHQLVIEDLANMHVPGWLLLILISYLTERSMYMRYKGESSSRKLLPGSSPQGAFLGILLFIIIFNGALLRPAIPRPNSLNLKYIDDLSMLEAFKLKTSLVMDPVDRVKPLTFNERTGQILPRENNTLQHQLNCLENFASQKLLKIKEKKTNLMKFNFSHNHDFPPEVTINGFRDQLEVIHETKLLGIMLTDDLKWAANCEYLCKKAYSKMWTLRRMKVLDVEPLVILDVYVKEIRSVLELAVPAWHSGLTTKQSADIERVQKVAVNIILSDCNSGKSEFSYNMALVVLDLEPLEVRRENLCLTFAKKTLKSRHSDMFMTNGSQHDTRDKLSFYENKSNTRRYFNSPLNYLTRLLNNS